MNTCNEIAAWAGVDPVTVRRWCRDHGLPHVLIAGRIHTDYESVIAWARPFYWVQVPPQPPTEHTCK